MHTCVYYEYIRVVHVPYSPRNTHTHTHSGSPSTLAQCVMHKELNVTGNGTEANTSTTSTSLLVASASTVSVLCGRECENVFRRVFLRTCTDYMDGYRYITDRWADGQT